MTICVAYGPTPEGAAALDLAVRESRLRGTRLVALATEQQERFETDTEPGDGGPLRERVESRLAALRADGDPETDVRVIDDGGDAAEAILDLAAAAGASLLVVGVRRRSPVGKLLTGSVAQRVILESPVPVLVTHAAR
ncbi:MULTISPECIES: universal stress protein [Pseudonocardia]|uniref:Universal stress protein n=2 Tax=Pseudonocardia TaxID=1847 RepID=A0A1Y2MTF3_PSEAH|nr:MULTISPECIES: universal stress protein [Pseudonocardia]OSY38484.1 Universal stress protein [Pseudonocardia autotrophica]TDN77073.1 universal stress protein family protein [Pseudonocardia autotrophica]BBG01079.1 universal stress protein UspA [Pseudonocardia autotrophica]GEC26707.1 universal stress protein UspA [Pseudonocardia saturnea]